jgi:DNA-directed RNA polymerase specialized sigma24 family protein
MSETQSELVVVGKGSITAASAEEEWSETDLDTDVTAEVGEDDNDNDTAALALVTPPPATRPRGASLDTNEGRPWPAGVPRNYDEMYQTWGKYVSNLIGRYNKVDRNFEELVQWIWEKLLQSNLLEKYVDRLYDSQETVSNFEACQFVGLAWSVERIGPDGKKRMDRGPWYKRMWRCYCGEPMGRKGNIPLGPDGQRLRKKSGWMPKIVKGTWASKEALLLRSDVIKFKEQLDEERMEAALEGKVLRIWQSIGESKIPIPASTDANFAGYLRRAVRNHFCNFVRHKERKEKERLHDHFFTFTNRLAQNEGAQWEDLLVDERSGGAAEASAELNAALAKMLPHIPEKFQKSLFDLLMEGVTLEHSINRLDATPEEKRTMSRAVSAVRPIRRQAGY